MHRCSEHPTQSMSVENSSCTDTAPNVTSMLVYSPERMGAAAAAVSQMTSIGKSDGSLNLTGHLYGTSLHPCACAYYPRLERNMTKSLILTINILKSL